MHIGKLKKPQFFVKNFNSSELQTHTTIQNNSKSAMDIFFKSGAAHRRMNQGAINLWLTQSIRRHKMCQIGHVNEYPYFVEFLECDEIHDYTKALYISNALNRRKFKAFLDSNLHLKDNIYSIMIKYRPDLYFIEILENRDIDAVIFMNTNFSSNLWTSHTFRSLIGLKDPDFLDKVASINPKRIGEDLGLLNHILGYSYGHEKVKRIKEVIHEKTLHKILEVNGSAISRIPQAIRTPEMYRLAINANGLAIQFLPKDERTKELCELAMQRSATAVKYVPKELQNKGLIMKLIFNGKNPLKYVK